MPTATEYQKHLLFIVRGQLISSCFTQELLDWIEGKKSYHSTTDKIQLIKSLENLDEMLEIKHNTIRKVIASLESLENGNLPEA